MAHLDSSPGVGVERKLGQQAATAAQLGLPLEFRALTGKEHGSRWSPVGILRRNRSNLRQIGAALESCDLVILRFPKVPFDLVLAFAHHGSRIVTEHHTDEIAELRGGGSPGRALLACAVAAVSRLLLRRAAGLIGVTDEIRRIELAKAGADKPSATVTNGVDVAVTGFTRFAPFDGRTLKLVMVASHFQPWHGSDRLLEGVRAYRGPIRVELALVGRLDAASAAAADRMNAEGRHAASIVGPAYGIDLERLMAEATVAVGSLALHRNGMREACTLKVREYAARGIPFVYAYDDSDIPADAAFALKLDCDDSPIDIGQVVEFARRVSGREATSEEMREFSRRHLDWRSRLEQMYDFASGLACPRR